MWKQFLKNRLFLVGLILCLFFLGGRLLLVWQASRESTEYAAETVRRLNERNNSPTASRESPADETRDTQKPTMPQQSPDSTPQNGHFHADGTWHADEHETEVQPASEVPQQQQENPSVIAQAPIDDVSIAEKHAEHQQRIQQYNKDREKWNEEFHQAHNERMQASQKLEKIIDFPDQESILRLSRAERQELASRVQAQMEKIDAADKKLKTVMQEEPVLPGPPLKE